MTRFLIARRTLALAFAITLAAAWYAPQPAAAGFNACQTNPNNWYTLQCLVQGQTAGPWGGTYGQWNSAPLNIAQAPAVAGGFLEHAMWYYNAYSIQGNGTCPTCRWLEVGDTAGFANQWIRTWFWVDATSGYIEHQVGVSPSNNSVHSYEIQYNGSGATQGWGVYIDFQAVGGYSFNQQLIAWADPSTFNNYRTITGLESTNNAFVVNCSNPNACFSNTNTRDGNNVTQTFEVNPLQIRSLACCGWSNWPAATSIVEGYQPCDTVASPSNTYPYNQGCYNGVSAGASVWRSNKPR